MATFTLNVIDESGVVVDVKEYKTEKGAQKAGDRIVGKEPGLVYTVVAEVETTEPVETPEPATVEADTGATRYVTGTRRTKRGTGVRDVVADFAVSPMTRDELETEILASDFIPPQKARYMSDAEKSRYIRGYLSSTISKGWLVEAE